MVQAKDPMNKIQMGGWSEEEYLLGYDKYVSNTCSNDHDDLSGSSSDKDVYHGRPRMMRPHKYLGKSCYHRIECTVATFLTTFMLRKPLNNVALATTTHKKAKESV